MDVWIDESARLFQSRPGDTSPTMDYSSSLNDTENPAGASPWSSSPQPSPQHNRSDYANAASNNDASSSSYNPELSQNNGAYTHTNQNYNTAASTSIAESVTDSSLDERRPGTADSMVDSQQGYAPVSQQQQAVPPVYNQESQRHAATRQQSRQGPQYRLQAKITGLERTGRKDPILRFDVYVRCVLLAGKQGLTGTD